MAQIGIELRADPAERAMPPWRWRRSQRPSRVPRLQDAGALVAPIELWAGHTVDGGARATPVQFR